MTDPMTAVFGPFTTAQDAVEQGKLWVKGFSAEYIARGFSTKVTDYHAWLYLTDDQKQRWRARERARFEDGTYTFVPWAPEDRYHDHYVHVAVKAPAMIAYTKDDQDGWLDKQTRVRPGKYLDEFYKDVPQSTRDQWIADIKAAPSLGFALATTADEIERVYRGKHTKTCSFKSCMGPDIHIGRDHFPAGKHPVRAYGDSDLAVAYLGPIDNVTARAVVWPAKKYWARAYGNITLTVLLTRAGYTHHPITGARLRALDASHLGKGYVLAPYVDNCGGRGYIDGDYIVLAGQDERGARMSMQSTSGYAEAKGLVTNPCQNCGDAEIVAQGRCQRCYDACRPCGICGTGNRTLYPLIPELQPLHGGHDRACRVCCERVVTVCTVDDCQDCWIEGIEPLTTQSRRWVAGAVGRMCETHSHTHRLASCGHIRSVRAMRTDGTCAQCISGVTPWRSRFRIQAGARGPSLTPEQQATVVMRPWDSGFRSLQIMEVTL